MGARRRKANQRLAQGLSLSSDIEDRKGKDLSIYARNPHDPTRDLALAFCIAVSLCVIAYISFKFFGLH